MKTLLTLATGLLLLAACKKNTYDNAADFDRAQLPAATQTGAQTLGCKIDGRVWTTFGKSEKGAVFGTGWGDNMTVSSFRAEKAGRAVLAAEGRMTKVESGKMTNDSQLLLAVLALDTLGGQRMLSTKLNEVMYYQDQAFNYYMSKDHNPVRVQITKLDRTLKIMSGTFEGYLSTQGAKPDSVRITEGRFDVKLPY